MSGLLKNPLTDAQLRASPIPVSGTLTVDGASIQRVQLWNEDGDAPVETHVDVDGESYLAVAGIQAVHASAGNTFAGTLGPGAIFYGTTESTLGIAGIQVVAASDQNCLVTVQQSGNSGTNWDVEDAYIYYHAKGGASWTTQAVGDAFRVVVQNSGSIATTYTRLSTALCPIVEAVPRALSSNGNFKVSIEEMLGTFGSKAKTTPTGRLIVTEATRLVGASFGGTVLDTNFWGSTAIGTGTIVPGGNQVTVRTGTVVASSGTLNSVRSGRYIASQSNNYRGVIRAPAVTGVNTRRWGAFNADDGYFFEHDGTTLSLVCRRAGVDNKVSSGSFNGDAGDAYDLPTTAVTCEIYWTNKSAWFLIDDVILHKFTGSTAPLTNTNTLPCRSECVNGAGNTNDNQLEIRVQSIVRQGPMTSLPILKNINTATTTILKYGAGQLHRVMVCTAGITGAKAAVYDNIGVPTAAARADATWGTLNVGVGSSNTISGQGNFVYDYACAPFYAGLTIVTTGATPADINVIYE